MNATPAPRVSSSALSPSPKRDSERVHQLLSPFPQGMMTPWNGGDHHAAAPVLAISEPVSTPRSARALHSFPVCVVMLTSPHALQRHHLRHGRYGRAHKGSRLHRHLLLHLQQQQQQSDRVRFKRSGSSRRAGQRCLRGLQCTGRALRCLVSLGGASPARPARRQSGATGRAPAPARLGPAGHGTVSAGRVLVAARTRERKVADASWQPACSVTWWLSMNTTLSWLSPPCEKFSVRSRITTSCEPQQVPEVADSTGSAAGERTPAPAARRPRGGWPGAS